MFSTAALLGRLALRNLTASFLSLLIGGIVLIGTLIFVVGGSLLSSIDKSMSSSIIGSVAGHAQVYNAESADSPALFDSFNAPELKPIPDFSKVKGPLLAHPNVKAVVPMGVNTAFVAYGNTVDLMLEKLRAALTRKPLAPRAKVESLKSHLRSIIAVIRQDYGKLAVVAVKGEEERQARRDLDKAASPAFWDTFDLDPLGHLEFLENKIASLVPDSDQIFFTYVGTDLDAFQRSFDRMEIVRGQPVPQGQRGILLSNFVYEQQFKLKVAYRLDQIKEALEGGRRSISQDPDLQYLIKQNRGQTREILLQLDPESARKASKVLEAATGSREADLAKLLAGFLDMDDANFQARYKVFYEELAPLIEIYRLRPGDTLTIKNYTKSGFVQAANLKVWGTFQFKGLEKSGLAGAMSLMDLVSFRDLYGYVTPEKAAETKALQRAAGAKRVERENAEAELFGGGAVVAEAAPQAIDEARELAAARQVSRRQASQTFSPAELESGMALEAALILKQPSKLKATLRDIERISGEQGLGLKTADWQTAAGQIGQFVLVAKALLYTATAFIFVVAMVVINNAVVMATLQRVREIGTLRAMGAQRGFVLSLVLAETVALGLFFGTLGAALGSAIVAWLQHAGIPARNEYLYFFFSGPRLRPDLSTASLVGSFVTVLLVTSASALYPARLATRVAPVKAMASED